MATYKSQEGLHYLVPKRMEKAIGLKGAVFYHWFFSKRML
jgi:hypothetical protein